MASSGILARGGFIAAVAVIVGISTLAPLMKRSTSRHDGTAPVAFAPRPAAQAGIQTPQSGAAPLKVATSALTLGEARGAGPSERAQTVPAAATAFPQPQTDDEAPARTAAEAAPPPPIMAAAPSAPTARKPARTKRAAKHRGLPSTPYSYERQFAAQ